MDMCVDRARVVLAPARLPGGFTSVSHNFVMEWAAVLRDIVIGLLIAGAAAAWIPDSFWQHLFLTDHPLVAKLWGPLIGPAGRRGRVRLLDRQRATGRGAVERRYQLRRRGLVHLRRPDHHPDHLITYAKYYGRRMAWFLTVAFYAHDGRSPATSSSWCSARCT